VDSVAEAYTGSLKEVTEKRICRLEGGVFAYKLANILYILAKTGKKKVGTHFDIQEQW
jgi:hypothetical protein